MSSKNVIISDIPKFILLIIINPISAVRLIMTNITGMTLSTTKETIPVTTLFEKTSSVHLSIPPTTIHSSPILATMTQPIAIQGIRSIIIDIFRVLSIHHHPFMRNSSIRQISKRLMRRTMNIRCKIKISQSLS